jgi:hypothetical protein
VSLVFLSTAVPNGTVFEFSEWADAAAHDLKGEALHALWSAERMLPAGAAQYAGRETRSPTLVRTRWGRFRPSFRDMHPKTTAAPGGKLSGAAEGMDSGRTPNRSSLVKT